MAKFKKGMTPWNKGLIGFNKGHRCYNDGKTFLGMKHSDETRAIMSLKKLGKTGELSNNWQGGKTKDQKMRMLKEYSMWRLKVFERDGFFCVNCDSNKNLEAHHKKEYAKYPELRLNVDNGVTLCKICHRNLHRSK